MRRYQLHDYRGLIGSTVKGVATLMKSRRRCQRAWWCLSTFCGARGENFTGQLKAQDPKTSHVFACQHGDVCRYQHDDITGWTEGEEFSTAATLAYIVPQSSLDALGQIRSGKTRI